MGLFSGAEFNSLDDLLLEQIQDLYDAETRLIDALPKMAEAATDTQLISAFRNHLAETNDQVKRLEKVFDLLGAQPQRETCEAMKGLIKEGQKVIDATGITRSRMQH